MFRHKPRWLCAHILTLLMVLALGIGSHAPSAFAKSPDESVVPESGGGGGGYGDPDQPQEPPKFAPGGDPEYTYAPESETTIRTRFGGAQVVGRNQFDVWSWRVRFWVAGLRFAYLRF